MGEVMINNRIVEMRRLVANIQAHLSENNVDSVGIMAHPRTKHRLVVEAANLAKKAGLDKVSILLE